MFKKALLFLALLGLGAFLMAGCGGGESPATETASQTEGQTDTQAELQNDSQAGDSVKKVKLNIGYLPTPGHVLQFVDKEKGFFEQEGLEVELFQFTNSGEGLNAIKAGKLDAGAFGTAAPQTFIAKGTPFINIAGMQSEGHTVIAKPENVEQFKTLEGFIGKKLATVRLATGDAVLRSAFSNEGIDWKTQVIIQELDSPAAVLEAVKKGAADAGIVWTPFEEMAKAQGLEVVDYLSKYMDSHVCCRVVVVEEILKQKREAFVRYVKALIRAYDFYTNHQDETVDIIAKYVKLDKELIKNSTYSGHIHSIPDPDKKRFAEFWEAMKKAGYIESDLDINQFVDPSIYQEALQALRAEQPDNPTYIQLEKDFSANNL